MSKICAAHNRPVIEMVHDPEGPVGIMRHKHLDGDLSICVYQDDSQKVELSEELIKSVDASGVTSIETRAKTVHEFLKKSPFTSWDITCFAIQYFAGLSLIHPILSTSAHVANRWLYLCHYVNQGFKEEVKI